MKITNLFDGPFHNSISEKGQKEVNKEHTEWMKEMFGFLICGIVLGVIIGVLL